MSEFNKSGSKYLRDIRLTADGKVDVYAVLLAFDVTCPARQHAIKKLLCSGLRGKGSAEQDLKEASDAIDRAIQLLPTKEDNKERKLREGAIEWFNNLLSTIDEISGHSYNDDDVIKLINTNLQEEIPT